ncbi:MAG: hypothetical protein PHH22_02235 [Clostridia bacterium]|nr:hypothetical protein [Clostridia bacterium]
MENLEFNFDDTINEIKAFKEYAFEIQNNNELATLTQNELLDLYSNLERTKVNLTQLKELLK